LLFQLAVSTTHANLQISLLEVATPQGGGEDLQLGSVEQLTPHISQPSTEYTFQPSAEYTFDLRYGFYAVMGGFALELDNEIREPEDSKRMAITTAGVLKLAEGGDFLMPDPETIADKSKADGIAKGLVIVQVTWMAVQVRHFFTYIACLSYKYMAGFTIVVCFAGLSPKTFGLSSDTSRSSYTRLCSMRSDDVWDLV